MTPSKPQRRSIYADRLAEFGDFAFGDDDVFKHVGRWREYFAERMNGHFDSRIIVEIGSADGTLLCAMAQKHPNTAFVGIDWKARQTYLAAERVAGMKLRNVALLRGRASDVGRIFASEEINEVIIFHPEPCDRPQERANRLLNDRFLLDASHILHDRGTLAIKTDHVGYYQWALARMGVQPPIDELSRERVKQREMLAAEELLPPSRVAIDHFKLDITSSDFWSDAAVQQATSHQPFAGEMTTYERRFSKKRQPIFYLQLSRRALRGS